MRTPHWERRLVQVETEMRGVSWHYGIHDCVQSTLRVFAALTGTDLRGLWNYGSRQAARRILGRKTIADEADRIAESLGLPQRPVELLHRGDPVLLRGIKTVALGWISSNGQIASAAQTGFDVVARSYGMRGWSV